MLEAQAAAEAAKQLIRMDKSARRRQKQERRAARDGRKNLNFSEEGGELDMELEDDEVRESVRESVLDDEEQPVDAFEDDPGGGFVHAVLQERDEDKRGED